jgi:hypothetical protein
MSSRDNREEAIDITIKNKLRGFSPRANYADRATAACWRT